MPKVVFKISKANILLGLVVILVVVLLGGSYKFYKTTEKLNIIQTQLATTTAELVITRTDKESLSQALYSEQQKNNLFESQIKEISGTVGTLDKLSKTDKELLQKYSKVYFLNEHYLPSDLATVTPIYVYEKERAQKIHAKALPYLEEMIKDAEKVGASIQVISAYRSFNEQSKVKDGYTFTYGSGANQFSADQGYSEHQLGTALDFTTSELGSVFTKFASTESFKWLLENAYKYGFILSYPQSNDYYQFEPWHWRFVGKQLAERLHEEGEYFYNLDQRKIDAYLITIFD